VITEDEARRFAKAHEFLWTLRCHLHWLAGRAEERLTYDMQTEIGRRMAYTDHAGTRGVERFMKHYFLIAKEVGNLTRIFCAAIEADHQRLGFIDRARRRLSRLGLGPRALGQRALEGFEVDGGRINVAHDRMFAEDPVNMMRLFELAQRHDLDVHPHALQLITRDLRRIDDRMRADPEANRLFLEILAAPRDSERVLRRMNEAGVFGRFLPDFGRVVAQMQYDMYHVYTVDEHTIFALGIMHRIEEGKLGEDHPLASEIVHKVASRRALYVAVLLHDIAKGRGGDHSILGEQVAHKVCPRLGLTDEETETVAWLVRWHLLLSNTAFKRDINDDKTIADFAQIVQSPERLRLLLCLTVADIRGVGPGIWNHWKASLLRQLYYRAEETLSGTPTAEGTARRVAAAQAALRVALPDWSEEEFQAHCARGYPGYWLGLDTATQVRHARLVREAERADLPLVVDRRIDVRQAVTEVTIYTADHPGLFGQLAGAFAVNAANIADAKIFTLANGMALDTFWIQDVEGKAFDRPDRLARLSVSIEQAIDGRLRPIQELSRRKSATPRTRELRAPPRVVIDDKASATHTVIEVNGRDRTGLLYELARALTELGLQISTAKISTYGANVVDVFYVKDIFGLKVGHEAKLAQIRERLLAVLSEPSAQEAPAAPPVRERRARVRAAG
jgi:[protein-PII] uridylyltransferase